MAFTLLLIPKKRATGTEISSGKKASAVIADQKSTQKKALVYSLFLRRYCTMTRIV